MLSGAGGYKRLPLLHRVQLAILADQIVDPDALRLERDGQPVLRFMGGVSDNY